ncbi:MAG: glutamate-1-semialdehyde 2,1-aminomutase [Deltaproteobacteria bacterium]|jgi:glutamate-1-semialdehyde 2,1-aminomutase|nr:glutamate-1-semialdehyde 2,1-aminomutase [Deltaproteobacteria bacterium]
MTTRSATAFSRAKLLFPGGVNSPARACRSVGADPVFAARGDGAFVIDVDQNRYLDYVGAFGPMILGHGRREVLDAMHAQIGLGLCYGMPTEIESELGAMVAHAMPGIERLRLVSSGTEATMSAIRLARGATGRAKIVKLEGCYHGHADHLLVKAGSGAMTLGQPDSAGVPGSIANETLVCAYNDLVAMEALFEAHPGQIAAVILEPVVGNMGVVPPDPGYLHGVVALCKKYGALSIFDEVMTGFRVAFGGAQGRYHVTADITCLGKIVGGGMPIGAYGARSDLMANIAPEGPVYQAGTNSGNPVACAAGLTTLKLLADPHGGPGGHGVYAHLEHLGKLLEAGLVEALHATGVPGTVQRVGSMITLFFTERMGAPVHRLSDVPASARERFGAFFRGMRERGHMLPPSQYEAWFISAAHTADDIGATVIAARQTLSELR